MGPESHHRVSDLSVSLSCLKIGRVICHSVIVAGFRPIPSLLRCAASTAMLSEHTLTLMVTCAG